MLARFRSLCRGLLKRRAVEREMSEEIEFHLSEHIRRLELRGIPNAEARRRARIEFGGIERYKEDGRASRGLRLFDELYADLRFALRQVRKSPSFACLAIAILAIGIGANTAVFSTVDSVMLALLPVDRPEQLRHFWWISERDQDGFTTSYNGNSTDTASGGRLARSVSYVVYEYLRDHSTSFSDIAALDFPEQVNVTVSGRGGLAKGQIVSGNFFRMLGVSAARGRVLSPEDDKQGTQPAAVLSHGFWERRFGSDVSALGQAISVNGTAAVVVGVLPKGWCGVDPRACPDLFLPMMVQPRELLNNPLKWGFELMGRLAPRITDKAAASESEALIAQAIAGYRPTQVYTPPHVGLEIAARGSGGLRDQMTSPLKILLWAVGAILLIACANIAGLLLARASARRHEIATRLSLGAGRGRIVRQLLVESLLLSSAGSIAGVALAYFSGDTIMRLFVGAEQQLGVSVTLNLRVLAASIGLGLLTSILFGLIPALQATRVDTAAALKNSRLATDRSRLLTAKGFIALQVAITLMLVMGSAVFVRTLANLSSEPLGFRPDHILTFQIDPTLNGYRNQRVLDFHEEIVRRLAEIPGVRSVSLSRYPLLGGGATSDGIGLPGKKPFGVKVHYIAPRFFETIGFPLLAGRDVDWHDNEQAELVMIVNQACARLLTNNENPVGLIAGMDGNRKIVGLAADTKYDSLRRQAPPTVYLPFRQNRQYSMTFVLRSEIRPESLIPAVRRAVESVDAAVPLFDIRTQEERIGIQMRRERVFAILLSGFGSMALLLACLGIYGTLAYQVVRRTPEIGVRMALGASRQQVTGMILREAVLPVAIGVAFGIGGALASGKLVAAFLFGLKPGDPATLATVACTLLAAAFAAGWIPSRRAAAITPMRALHYD